MSRRRFAPLLLLTAVVTVAAEPATRPAGPSHPPAVGDRAADFTLQTLDDKPVQLSELTKSGPVVLVELRGWVGYQCPICTKQVGQFMAHGDDLKKAGATVVFIYPGPAGGLQAHAADFVAGKGLPANDRFVLDPGDTFATAYGIRWVKANETAFPSTFVVGTDGLVRFAKVSHTHGGRATVDQVLAALEPAKP